MVFTANVVLFLSWQIHREQTTMEILYYGGRIGENDPFSRQHPGLD
jgi:hypothetical protein